MNRTSAQFEWNCYMTRKTWGTVVLRLLCHLYRYDMDHYYLYTTTWENIMLDSTAGQKYY